jgi:CcmD family protein
VEGSLLFLVAALIIVWLGIIGYFVVLSGRLGALQRELEALKRSADELADDDEH